MDYWSAAGLQLALICNTKTIDRRNDPQKMEVAIVKMSRI